MGSASHGRRLDPVRRSPSHETRDPQCPDAPIIAFWCRPGQRAGGRELVDELRQEVGELRGGEVVGDARGLGELGDLALAECSHEVFPGDRQVLPVADPGTYLSSRPSSRNLSWTPSTPPARRLQLTSSAPCELLAETLVVNNARSGIEELSSLPPSTTPASVRRHSPDESIASFPRRRESRLRESIPRRRTVRRERPRRAASPRAGMYRGRPGHAGESPVLLLHLRRRFRSGSNPTWCWPPRPRCTPRTRATICP